MSRRSCSGPRLLDRRLSGAPPTSGLRQPLHHPQRRVADDVLEDVRRQVGVGLASHQEAGERRLAAGGQAGVSPGVEPSL